MTNTFTLLLINKEGVILISEIQKQVLRAVRKLVHDHTCLVGPEFLSSMVRLQTLSTATCCLFKIHHPGNSGFPSQPLRLAQHMARDRLLGFHGAPLAQRDRTCIPRVSWLCGL